MQQLYDKFRPNITSFGLNHFMFQLYIVYTDEEILVYKTRKMVNRDPRYQ